MLLWHVTKCYEMLQTIALIISSKGYCPLWVKHTMGILLYPNMLSLYLLQNKFSSKDTESSPVPMDLWGSGSTILPNGELLFIGSGNPDSYRSSAVYNLQANTW